MLTIDRLKQRLSEYGNGVGDYKRHQSDMIMEATWEQDLQSKKCYLYDFFHDSTPELNKNILPQNDKLKTPVDVKFIVNAYNSESKDQVSYHIQFKPSQKCNVDYYDKEFGKKYDAEFPYGLYIDIPDNKGIYRRWLICTYANNHDQQFSTYGVLPCDHKVQWIHDNKKYQMWAVLRSQNSYNSGLWTDYRFETPQDQQQFVVPLNRYSETLYYNHRMILDGKVSTEPIAWKVSKTHRFSINGICRITLSQDLFNAHTDYIEKDAEGNIIGMWADYYKSNIQSEEIPNTIFETDKYETIAKISHSGINSNIKIGGSYKTFTIEYFNKDNELISTEPFGEWSFYIDDKNVSDLVNIILPNSNNNLKENQIKIKFTGDDDYLGKILTIKNINSNNIQAICNIEIIGL